jgi:hypothetical protein
MMVFSTLFIAVIVIGVLWFLLLQRLRQAWMGYVLVLAAGIACFLFGSVHFVYIGIEVIGLGCLVVWLRHTYWPPAPKSKSAGAGDGA